MSIRFPTWDRRRRDRNRRGSAAVAAAGFGARGREMSPHAAKPLVPLGHQLRDAVQRRRSGRRLAGSR